MTVLAVVVPCSRDKDLLGVRASTASWSVGGVRGLSHISYYSAGEALIISRGLASATRVITALAFISRGDIGSSGVST